MMHGQKNIKWSVKLFENPRVVSQRPTFQEQTLW